MSRAHRTGLPRSVQHSLPLSLRVAVPSPVSGWMYCEAKLQCNWRGRRGKSFAKKVKFEEKEEKIRNGEIKKLLFDKYLNEIDNVRNRNRDITTFFTVQK